MDYRKTLDFLLHDWLDVGSLQSRSRFADHTRETFSAVLDTCEKIARDKFAPCNRLMDEQEPWLDGVTVRQPEGCAEAFEAYAHSGMLAASDDYEVGGMQLPCTVEIAANSFFSRANVSLSSVPMLTSGNARVLVAHGTPLQQQVFAIPQFSGKFGGTMCLSEPQAGSSLSDIATRATPDGTDYEHDPLGPRYRLRGNKMWISNGDHELTENIVHLVLAKIPSPDGKLISGPKGISLFVVPKKLVHANGELTGERNDVVVAGLNHKLGYRGAPNTLLNFGEGAFPARGESGAIGYLVGNPHEGLRYMFHLMNEARLAVGVSSTMLGYAGFESSLEYAKGRLQGRPVGPGGKDSSKPQVPIIQHADIKRMLLAQKSYCEGALALGLYCAKLIDEQRTGTPEASSEAALLLEVLIPVAKAWPSEWCLEANNLAIQILGGYGYTRDFPVEQLWRDNRLNMIHEGTHGIQGLDLLGRKVVMQQGAGLALLTRKIQETIDRAKRAEKFAVEVGALSNALERLNFATRNAWATGSPDDALANATLYLQAFGHVVLAWTWLDVGLCACFQLDTGRMEQDLCKGKLAALEYFYRYELPKIEAWLCVVETRAATCRLTEAEWL